MANLGVDSLELVQLHCPPTEVYYQPEVFGIMDDLVKAGKVQHYGVSVEKVEEALKAIEFPGVESVQIIFNMFRLRPADHFLGEAKRRGVATIIRVPLASGMLTGKITAASTFEPDDHRNFNRHGEAFDVGETFSGVPYDAGLQAVEELKALVPQGATLAQLALRWILMFDGVSTVIPGAKTAKQVEDNSAASKLPPIRRTTNGSGPLGVRPLHQSERPPALVKLAVRHPGGQPKVCARYGSSTTGARQDAKRLTLGSSTVTWHV